MGVVVRWLGRPGGSPCEWLVNEFSDLFYRFVQDLLVVVCVMPVVIGCFTLVA